jgi:hypothetical protein
MGFEGLQKSSCLRVLGGCLFGLMPTSTHDLGKFVLGFVRIFRIGFGGVI